MHNVFICHLELNDHITEVFMCFLDKKLQQVLPYDDYFKQGLYTFDMGQNDLDDAFYSKSEDQVVASIPAILTELETRFEVIEYLSYFSRIESLS